MEVSEHFLVTCLADELLSSIIKHYCNLTNGQGSQDKSAKGDTVIRSDIRKQQIILIWLYIQWCQLAMSHESIICGTFLFFDVFCFVLVAGGNRQELQLHQQVALSSISIHLLYDRTWERAKWYLVQEVGVEVPVSGLKLFICCT
jgi:hypothetical protein